MKGILPERQLLIMLLFALGFDQISKEGARFLGFSTTFNTGISLGLLGTFSSEIITGVVLSVIVFLWYQFRTTWLEHPVVTGLFFGAGVSNVLDRVWYGAVRDWLPVPGTEITNNLADWMIFVTLGYFLFSLMREGRKGRV